MMCCSMHLYAGILAEQAVGPAVAIDHFREAVAVNRRLGSPPFTALALAELSRLVEGTPEGRRARAEAREIAEGLGATHVAIHPRTTVG